jgi:hypothetical protein
MARSKGRVLTTSFPKKLGSKKRDLHKVKLDDLHEAGKSAAYNPEYGFSDLSPFHVSTIFLTLVSNNSNQ